MQQNGWIKIHRKILEWGWYEDTNTFRVFLDLLLHANWTPSEYRGVRLDPGDVVIGLHALAKRLHMSVHQVRTALEHLKMTNEVAIKTTNKFSVVTIVKWRDYQVLENESGKQNGKQDGKQMATLEEYKKYKEDKEGEVIYNVSTQNETDPDDDEGPIPTPDDFARKWLGRRG